MNTVSTLSIDFSPDWGARIRKARRDRKLSQEILAMRVPVSRNTVNRWENEQYPVPPAVLPALASALGVSIDWIRTGEGPMEPPTITGTGHMTIPPPQASEAKGRAFESRRVHQKQRPEESNTSGLCSICLKPRFGL